MTLSHHKRAIGTFPNRRDAESALRDLRNSHYPMDKISVITQDSNRIDPIAGTNGDKNVGNKADEGVTTGAVTGGALGGLTGLLVGLGTLAIPGVGPILLAGATATAIATTLAGGAIGAAAGGLVGALIGLGIPEHRARVYSERVSRGDYLVIVEGTEAEIRRAERILHHHGIQEWDIFDAPKVAPSGNHLVTAKTSDSHFDHHHSRAIGVFPHYHHTEAAIRELNQAGFPLSQISIISRDQDRHNWIPGLKVRDRFDKTSLGFLNDRHHFFHDQFKQGEFLIILEGTNTQIRGAEAILNRHGVREWESFDAPDDNTDHSRRSNSMANTSHSLGHHHRAVGTFSHRPNMDTAIQELYDADFPMNQVSVIARDYQRHNLIPNLTIRDRFDSAFGFLGQRHSLFHDRFNRGAFLVMVEGTQAQIHQAETILRGHGMQDWGIYNSTTGQVKQPPGTNRISDAPEVVIVDRRH